MPELFEKSTGTSELEARKVWNELQGNWQQDNDFFPRFFPTNAHVRKTLSKAKPSLYKASDTNPRWLRVPQEPTSLSPRFYTALNNLLNNILGYFMPNYDDQHPRLFIRTYRRKVLPNLEKSIWPAILLAGAGSSFVNKTTVRPIADYRSAISPFEVVLEDTDMELARRRLAIIVQEIFSNQSNRRYTFGLIISSSSVTCYLFDHSGVVFSPPLDYHKYPDQFCALIGGITSTDENAIGLDNSVYIDAKAEARICTRDPRRNHAPLILYYVDCALYHASSIMGRSTTCFLAHRGDPKTLYVIKDAWISADDPELEGRESEASLLLYAKSKGVVRGVAQLCHSEEVRLKGSNGKLFVDDIYHIRRLKPSEYSRVRQRVHTRIVMSTYGKTLEEFSSRKELLLAYYDAVQAHRNLYQTAGVLHRDIKPSNILINFDGEEGERGILIDFDHAIRTGATTPYSLQKNVGTYLFMSSNVIRGTAPHDYLDDLESFYYVLVYILMIFQRPHSTTHHLPAFIRAWEGPSAASAKRGHFIDKCFDFEIQPWFGAPFRNLVDRLHSLWHKSLIEIALAKKTPIEPTVDYNQFLSHVREAISELERDEEGKPDMDVARPFESIAASPSHSRPKKCNMNTDNPTIASLRSLRQNVTYGPRRND